MLFTKKSIGILLHFVVDDISILLVILFTKESGSSFHFVVDDSILFTPHNIACSMILPVRQLSWHFTFDVSH